MHFKSKMTILVCILFLASGLLFAKGEQEETKKPEKIELVLVHGYASYYQVVMDQFEADYPNAVINWVPKGSNTSAADVLIKVGKPPNVFMSTPGDVGRFLMPGFALELTDDNIANLDDYRPGVLDIYIRDGQILALPVAIAVNAMNINLSLAEQVGFKVPDRDYLTIAELIEFSRLIKLRGPEGTYGTAFHLNNGGSQGVNMNWFASFGAELFGDGYEKTTINTQAAVDTLEFIKYMIDNEYASPDALVLDDDEALNRWAQGKYGIYWSRAGGMFGMPDNAVTQGLVKERFKSRFMSWPKAPGVEYAPLTFGGAAGLVIKSGDAETDKLAAALLDYMTGAQAQNMTIIGGGNYPSRYSATMPVDGCIGETGCVENNRVLAIAEANGLYDLGYSTLVYGAIASEWLTLVQAFVSGDITAQVMLDTWEAKINDLLSQ